MTFAADGNDAPMPFCVQQGRAQAGRGRAFEQPVANCGKRPWTIRCAELFLFFNNIFKKDPRGFAQPWNRTSNHGLLAAGRGSSEFTGALFRSSHQSTKLVVGSGRVVVVCHQGQVSLSEWWWPVWSNPTYNCLSICLSVLLLYRCRWWS